MHHERAVRGVDAVNYLRKMEPFIYLFTYLFTYLRTHSVVLGIFGNMFNFISHTGTGHFLYCGYQNLTASQYYNKGI